MVEEYQQAISVANHGGIRDVQGLYPQLGLKNSPQVSNLKNVIFFLELFVISRLIYEHNC